MIHDEEYEKHYSPDGEHIEYLMENPQPTQPQQEEWEKDLQGELRCYRSCCELDKMRERGESEDRIFLIIKHTISEIRKEERGRIIKEFERAIISRMPAFSPNEKVTELKLFSLKDLAELIKKL